MNKKEFIQRIKDIKLNVPDEEFFLKYNKTVYDILDNQEKLIKYIEDFISKTDYEVNIKGNHIYLAWSNAYKDLLERIKNNNYD